MDAFLHAGLPFLAIAETVAAALEAVDGGRARDLDDLLEADAGARRVARDALADRGVALA